jgi:hypothetical protein
MTEQSLTDADLWQRVLEEFLRGNSTSPARAEFFGQGVDRVQLVRQALRLRDGNNRAAAISLLRQMGDREKKQLFSELLQLARCAHGPVGVVREIILSLPPSWVKKRVGKEVAAILRGEEYDDYWMLLQLYEQLDPELARKLAHRAADHPVAEIRELGGECLARLPAPASRPRPPKKEAPTHTTPASVKAPETRRGVICARFRLRMSGKRHPKERSVFDLRVVGEDGLDYRCLVAFPADRGKVFLVRRLLEKIAAAGVSPGWSFDAEGTPEDGFVIVG